MAIHELDRAIRATTAANESPRGLFTSRRILVAVDSSDQAAWASEVATGLADQFGCDLGLIHVFDFAHDLKPEGGTPWETDATAVVGRAERFLAEFPARAATGHKVERFLRDGDAVEEIVNTARGWHADLIVIGTHARRGLKRLFLGSVAAGVVRAAHCPVLCVSCKPTGPIGRRILVAMDPSDPARWAMEWAGAMAQGGQCDLLLLHTVPFPAPMEPGYGLVAADIAATLRSNGEAFLDTLRPDVPPATPIHRHVRQGHAAHEIVAAAAEWNGDLIVMGAFSKHGLARVVLGSTADAVLRRSTCPVLCISHEPHPLGLRRDDKSEAPHA